jgi:hypothetical protein
MFFEKGGKAPRMHEEHQPTPAILCQLRAVSNAAKIGIGLKSGSVK